MVTKLHILTLNWDGEEKLNTLNLGLYNNLIKIKSELDIDYTWYIRDNGSKDESVKIANNFNNIGLDTQVFEIGHNRYNFSQGVNYLFDKANPKDDDLILLLNNDIEFNDDASLSKMIKLMTNDVGMVGARLLYPNTNKLQHAGVIFSEQYGLMPYHFKHKDNSDYQSQRNRYFQAVTGACCLIKASEFKKYYLDEKMFWAFEDIILGLQIGKNKKIVYCGSTNISHGESQSLKLNPVNKMFLESNVKLFKDRWFGKYEIDHNYYLNNIDHNVIV